MNTYIFIYYLYTCTHPYKHLYKCVNFPLSTLTFREFYLTFPAVNPLPFSLCACLMDRDCVNTHHITCSHVEMFITVLS